MTMEPTPLRPDRAAILTIEAASPGGVPALVDVLYRLMQRWGLDPLVMRSQFAPGELTVGQRIAATLSQWRARRTIERGLDAVLVPAPPLPLWGFYAVPHFLAGPLLGGQEAVFVASGSAHVALPLALRGIPYVLWVATLYEDELAAKQAVGDAWAEGVLRSRTWPLLAAQERFVLRRAERVLALSYTTADRIRGLVPGAADRVETVLFPVDTDRFRPDPAARAESPHVPYLLLAARINDPRKNVPMLLDAFAQINAARPDLSLVLVGEEPNDVLRAQVVRLGLEEAVVFGGIVPADELLRLYQGAELFVLPSLQEGLGIVVLEALACGTPVVTTACGGPEGIVQEGETGRVVADPHAAGTFAAAVLDALADPTRLAAMREASAAYARETYSFPVISERLRDAYDEARQAGPQPSRLAAVLAALWAVVVVAAYTQHQLAIHADSIRAQIVEPLLGVLQ